jgi:hypothetical protein
MIHFSALVKRKEQAANDFHGNNTLAGFSANGAKTFISSD